MDDRLLNILPFLESADSETAKLLRRYGRPAHISGGEFIAVEGQDCDSLIFLLEGAVRVFKAGASGREITLYRIQPGDGCILSISCILSDRVFPAYAVTEAAVDAVVVPAAVFRDWVERFESWRQYVFDLLARRLGTVMAVIEEVSFRRLDARLAAHLLELSRAANGQGIRLTHEAIAAELGSSREVVSRLLKDFERSNLVALARGHVTVTDPQALGELTSSK